MDTDSFAQTVCEWETVKSIEKISSIDQGLNLINYLACKEWKHATGMYMFYMATSGARFMEASRRMLPKMQLSLNLT